VSIVAAFTQPASPRESNAPETDELPLSVDPFTGDQVTKETCVTESVEE
jgi:hypothetical protein